MATAATAPLPTGRADRYLVAVRRLDEGTAALLWSRGLALSPEAAIDLAIEQVLPAPRPGAVAGPAGAAFGTTASAPGGGLTAREREIAVLIASGRSNKAIAGELVISPATVARHVANIMAKLGFRNRAQIAAWITGRSRTSG